jgi:type I restriction enzyme S subunit
MNNWKQQKLGIVADVKLSNVDKLTDENERVVRLCNYTDVYKNSFINLEKSESFMLASCNENEYEKFILKKGQVAITKDSETPNDIGVSTYISEDFEDVVLGYHLALITPDKEKLNGQFLHYWLNTKQAKRYFENNAGGSGQRCTIVLDCIKSTPLYLPNLSIQEKIAKVLSDLDAKIELNNRINRELEALAKTLYDYWFVQFDFPNEQGIPYKSSGGKMVYNIELKREIPEGWEFRKIGVVATIKAGGDKPENFTIEKTMHNKIPIYSNGISNDGLYGYTDKAIINNQSVTISARGTIGFCVLRNKPYVPIIRLISLIPKLEGSAKFFYETLKHFIFENSGSVQQQLTVPQVQNIKIIYPSEYVLKEFDKITSPMIDSIEILKEENQQLSELRDWLLPMLMNGQVTVQQVHGKAVKEVEEKVNLNMAAEAMQNYGTK